MKITRNLVEFIIVLVLFYSTLFFINNPLMLAILGILILIVGTIMMLDY